MEPSLQNNIQPQQPAKKPTNPLLIIGIVYGLVVILLVTAIAVVLVTRGNSGSGGSSEPVAVNSTLTLELAESVCQKYGGSGSSYTLDDDNSLSDVLTDAYTCTNYSDTNSDDLLIYTVYFVKDGEMDSLRSILDSYTSYSGPGVEVLEESEQFSKLYTKMSSIPFYMYVVVYGNVLIQVNAVNSSLAESLLVELGSPEHEWTSENTGNGGDSSDHPSTPTMEVAESLCKKYGGKFVDVEDTRYGGILPVTDGVSETKVCEYVYGTDDDTISNDSFVFSYQIGFLKDSNKDEYRKDLRDYLLSYKAYEDVSAYTILEDSDDMIKACNSVAGLIAVCVAMHGNAVAGVTSGTGISSVDEIFAELGFPNRSTLKEYAQSKQSD